LETVLFVAVSGIFFVTAGGRSLGSGKDDLAAAQAADQRGDHATAISLYTNARGSGVPTEKEQAASYRGCALDERDQQQFEKAIADQTEAIKRTRDDEMAILERGAIYPYLGRIDATLVDFTTAIGLKPNDVTALTDRGAILAVTSEPSAIGAILNRAAALRGLGDRDSAIADINAVIRLRPDVAAAYYERGNTYRDKSDAARSIADYNTSMRLKPDYVDALTTAARRINSQNNIQRPSAISEQPFVSRRMITTHITIAPSYIATSVNTITRSPNTTN
jgi:tetratricopeptide (TPR) repeat protein